MGGAQEEGEEREEEYGGEKRGHGKEVVRRLLLILEIELEDADHFLRSVTMPYSRAHRDASW